LPLAELLGGSTASVPAYNSNGLGIMPPEEAATEATQLVAEGFSAIKIRLGRATATEDLAAVRAVRSRIPSDVLLMADFNQALSVNEAIHRGSLLDGEGLVWIEEPVRADDLAGCARVAAELKTPVQIGENFGAYQNAESLNLTRPISSCPICNASAASRAGCELRRWRKLPGAKCPAIFSRKSAPTCWP
jgi:mandelate racemase